MSLVVIDVPEKENPKTKPPAFVLTVNPASAAEPPDAPLTEKSAKGYRFLNFNL